MTTLINGLQTRLDAIDRKLESLQQGRRKPMEWIATLSEHVRSLDAFREEVRASYEPLLAKLDNIDDILRILRHATSDMSRRVESLEQAQRKAS